jgi:hypothetical protein
MALARRIDIDGWATLLMRRGGGRRENLKCLHPRNR